MGQGKSRAFAPHGVSKKFNACSTWYHIFPIQHEVVEAPPVPTLGFGIHHSPILSSSVGRIDFNTINPSLPTWMDFLIHPCTWIDDEENVHTPPKLGRYWEIHLRRPRDFRRDFPWAKPEGYHEGRYFPRFGGAWIQCVLVSMLFGYKQRDGHRTKSFLWMGWCMRFSYNWRMIIWWKQLNQQNSKLDARVDCLDCLDKNTLKDTRSCSQIIKVLLSEEKKNILYGTTLLQCYTECDWRHGFIRNHSQCFFLKWSLKVCDDLEIFPQWLQEYSRPSMCFSTCSRRWPRCLDV